MFSDFRYNPNSKHVHDFWKDNFNNLNDFYVNWETKSYELKLASELIYQEFKSAVDTLVSQINVDKEEDESLIYRQSFGSIWMMLCGYSLECLVKGMYFIVNPNENIRDGKVVVDWKGSGHDLITLMNLYNEIVTEEIRISLNENEISYLRRASEHSLWIGKYPLPKKYQNTIPVLQEGEGYAPLGLINVKGDKDTYEEIYTKLQQLFETCYKEKKAEIQKEE